MPSGGARQAEQATFIYFLRPKREGMVDAPTDTERSVLQAHFEYLRKSCDEGIVVLAGPSTDPPPTGIVILRTAGREEAQEFMNEDPAIKNEIMAGRLSAFRISMMSG